jgi:proteic killer suppression protein
VSDLSHVRGLVTSQLGVEGFLVISGRIKNIAGLVERVARQLDALNSAVSPEDMNLPRFSFQKLRCKPARNFGHVNGPWCVTFGWHGEDAVAVDLENCH